MIAPTNAEVLPILPEPESLELKKHLKQVGKEQKRSRGRVCMMAQQVMAPAISSDSWVGEGTLVQAIL